jgi:hypothetical protein
MEERRVAEFHADGKEVWSFTCPDTWTGVRLKNGNTLISGD